MYPDTWGAVLGRIPRSVVDEVSGNTLAQLVDSIYDNGVERQSRALREACQDGYIWDGDRGITRDIALPQSNG
jgi:hypothetical protein